MRESNECPNEWASELCTSIGNRTNGNKLERNTKVKWPVPKAIEVMLLIKDTKVYIEECL